MGDRSAQLNALQVRGHRDANQVVCLEYFGTNARGCLSGPRRRHCAALLATDSDAPLVKLAS